MTWHGDCGIAFCTRETGKSASISTTELPSVGRELIKPGVEWNMSLLNHT